MTRSARRRRHPMRRVFIGSGIVALVAAAAFAAVGYNALETDRLLADAPVARAVVTEVHDGNPSARFLIVEFATAQGAPVRAELHEGYWRPYPAVGDVIDVRYNADHPDQYLRDVRGGGDGGLVVICAIAVVALLSLGIGSLVGRLPDWVVKYRKR